MPAEHSQDVKPVFVCMKRLLVVRVPSSVPPNRQQEIAEQIRTKVSDEFTVLVFGDNVENTEVEIIYDPNFKADTMGMENNPMKVFAQVDTSTGAFMGGKP